MKLSSCITICTLFFLNISFGQNFKSEKLLGNWDAKYDNVVQTYQFIDESHVIIYNSKNIKSKDSPLKYRLENITASGFFISLSSEVDTDKTHEAKSKCKWINDNQFTLEPAQVIIGGGLKIIFTRKK